MNREDFEVAVAASVLRDPKLVGTFKGRFKAALFTDGFLLAVANAAAMAFKGSLPLDQGLAAVASKFPNAADRFDTLSHMDVSPADFAWARDSLLAMLDRPKEPDVARDSGKDAPGRDPRPEPPADSSRGGQNRPAAENSDTQEGEQDPRGEGGHLTHRTPLQELEAKLVNYDAEQALLGAVLANETVYSRVQGFVKPEDFADPLHGRIFWACGELVAKGVRPSPISLKNMFDQDGALKEIGGAKYLVELAKSVVSILGADDFARAVADLASRRNLLATLERTKDQLLDFTQDSNALIAQAMHRLPEGMGGGSNRIRTKHQVREAIARKVDKPGVFYPTGIAGLDDLLGGGFFGGKLYGLAARFKAGKTALSGSISHALNDRGTMHGFAALEMTDEEIEMRDVARDLKVNSIRLMKGTLAHDPIGGGRVIETMGDTPNATVYFSEPGANLADLRAFVLQAMSQFKITGFIVDYHQLIGRQDMGQTEEWHLRTSAEALQKICKQFGLWCLLVLQLNQEGNARGGEGIKLACDAYMTLVREKGSSGAHVELELCRYKESASMGSTTVPGLIMDPHGPHFIDNTGSVPEDQPELVL